MQSQAVGVDLNITRLECKDYSYVYAPGVKAAFEYNQIGM